MMPKKFYKWIGFQIDQLINNEFWSWSNLKDEIIFLGGAGIAYSILLTIATTEYYALVGTLIVTISMAGYYSFTFFNSPSIQKLYFYFCTLFILIGYFALVYKSFGVIPPSKDTSEQLNWLDAFYFSVVTWTTLGYGDFRPSDDIKLWVIAEALIGYVYMGLLVGKIIVLGHSKNDK